MRKYALKMVLITGAAGVFGAFFRWLENINAFEEDTGLMIPNAKTALFMAVYLIAAAALFAALAYVSTKRFACSQEPETALRTHTIVPGLACRLFGAAIMLTGVALMFYAPGQRSPTLARIFASASIFDGVAVIFLPLTSDGRSASGGSRGLSLVPVIFSCIWLVCCYKNNAENPVVWAYLVEILAVMATLMAWYELAAYFYGRAKPFATLFFVQAAAFMDIATLSDERGAAMTVMFAVHAALMLMFEFLLSENLAPHRHAHAK